MSNRRSNKAVQLASEADLALGQWRRQRVGAVYAGRARGKAGLTAEAMLFWAFNQQLVVVMDRAAQRCFSPRWPSTTTIGRLAAAQEPDDTAVETACWGASAVVHPDAQLFAACVTDVDDRDVLALYGEIGAAPEWCAAEPRAMPMSPDRYERFGRAHIDGQEIRYLIRVVERVNVVKPIIEKQGRRKVVVGQENVATDVEWCPIDWTPHPEWVEQCNATYHAYQQALAALRRRLVGVAFRDYEVIDAA